MLHNKEKQIFFALEDWFLSEHGQYIIHFFHQELVVLKEMMRGDIILQLGNCGNQSLFSSFDYRVTWVASVIPSPKADLITSFRELPFDKNSIDCIILPFVNEVYSYDTRLLDEVDRVLKPGGHLIFLGINPFSFWGAWLTFTCSHCFGHNKIKMRTIYHLKRALKHRGYDQQHYSNFYYLPPAKNIELIKSFRVINYIGKLIAPWPPNLFCFVAQKKQVEPINFYSFKLIKGFNFKTAPSTYCRSQFNHTCGKISSF